LGGIRRVLVVVLGILNSLAVLVTLFGHVLGMNDMVGELITGILVVFLLGCHNGIIIRVIYERQ
jgi:hypothetical protein